MLKKRLSIVISIAVGCWLVALFVQCDKASGPAPSAKTVEVLAPHGGERYKVGDTVVIRWKINDESVVPSVGIKLSLNGGRTFLEWDLEPAPILPQITSFSWIIGSDQVSDSCVIQVYVYGQESIYHNSGAFSVTN